MQETGVQNPIEIIYLSAKLNETTSVTYNQNWTPLSVHIHIVAMVLYLSFFVRTAPTTMARIAKFLQELSCS